MSGFFVYILGIQAIALDTQEIVEDAFESTIFHSRCLDPRWCHARDWLVHGQLASCVCELEVTAGPEPMSFELPEFEKTLFLQRGMMVPTFAYVGRRAVFSILFRPEST
jgi:hypothetical protein